MNCAAILFINRRKLTFSEKSRNRSPAERREMTESEHERLSMREHCRLLGLHRLTPYYQPRSIRNETDAQMRRIDEMQAATTP